MPRRNRLLSDLVRDSEIETEFIDSRVVEHIFYETGRSARRRRVRNVERWTKERQLGQGAYGKVYLHTCQDGGVIKSRAVKEVKKFVIVGEELDYASELEAIMKFSHSKYRHCFVISDGWYELEDTIFITMEYFELGDLQQYIATPLRESETVQIVDQVLEGLEFMHDNGFIHRDLKPANIIVVDKSPEWFVKIADFGISRRRHNDTTSLTMQLVTLGFVAPEVIGSDSEKSYTYSVDMWSLGAMAYRILTSTMAFQGLDGMFKYVLGNVEFPVTTLESHGVSENGRDFILKLMQPDPVARPSAESAANHAWITSPITSDREKESASLEKVNTEGAEESGISTASKMWSMSSGSNQPAETMRQQPSPVPEQSSEPTNDEISTSISLNSNESNPENEGQTSYQMVIRQRETTSKPEPERSSDSDANYTSDSENDPERVLLDASGPIKIHGQMTITLNLIAIYRTRYIYQEARLKKTCDFCVSRKIKCDSLRPNCTNCVLNGVPCKLTVTNAVSKRTPVRANQPAAAKVASSIQRTRIDAVEARLASIESHLERLASLTPTAYATAQHAAPSQPPHPPAAAGSDFVAEGPAAPPAWSHEPQATTPEPASSERLDLPPLSEVLPLVDNYFKNFNTIMPIFEEASFMRMLLDLYSSPTKPATVPWAAVNVAIAVGYRIVDGLHMEDPKLASCLRKAESVMSDLMVWKKDLLGLQTLVCIAIVHHGSFNPELSTVLIGSIIRLVRSMGLNLKQSLQGYSPEVALQRSRVFWLAYIIDRDLCLLTGLPYNLLDTELDIEIPEVNSFDGKGIIYGKNDIQFNVLRSHVQLAYIQGKAFDVVYGQNITAEQKQAQMFQIEKMLYNVQRCVPEDFQSAEVIAQLPAVSSQLIVTFFFRHLECIFRLHSMLSFNVTWISRVMSYLSPAVIQLGEDEIDSDVSRENLTPLPPRWLEFVNYCRQYLSLSLPKTYVDYTLRLRACCTFSSLIILLVNLIEFPDHNFILSDRHLIDVWREKLTELGVDSTPEYADMYNVLEQLDRRARGQVKRIAHSNSSGSPGSANQEFGNFWPTSPGGEM